MRTERDLSETIETYGDTIKRICILYLKNPYDTEEIFQNVFLKYYNNLIVFDSEEHKKAWIIRVCINECKNLLKNFFRKNVTSVDVLPEISVTSDFNENAYVREMVLKLPEKYRTVIYLHYFEGYSAVDIAKIIKKNVNTVYTHLARGKYLLKKALRSEGYEG